MRGKAADESRSMRGQRRWPGRAAQAGHAGRQVHKGNGNASHTRHVRAVWKMSMMASLNRRLICASRRRRGAAVSPPESVELPGLAPSNDGTEPAWQGRGQVATVRRPAGEARDPAVPASLPRPCSPYGSTAGSQNGPGSTQNAPGVPGSTLARRAGWQPRQRTATPCTAALPGPPSRRNPRQSADLWKAGRSSPCWPAAARRRWTRSARPRRKRRGPAASASCHPLRGSAANGARPWVKARLLLLKALLVPGATATHTRSHHHNRDWPGRARPQSMQGVPCIWFSPSPPLPFPKNPQEDMPGAPAGTLPSRQGGLPGDGLPCQPHTPK